ncbi:leucine-rich repeat extensin-like protein 6 [Aristolochia californica]|uniref:leucine-rich repeat extensin-like protein 6 n=1 Tax=Aristolochia californica TaxID=171875 RepID=UPI0035E2DC3C
MGRSWFLALLLLQVVSSKAYYSGGVAVGGGSFQSGGFWVGGGITSQGPSGFSGSSGSPNSRLSGAYTALQAWKSAITEDPSGILNSWVGPDVCSYKGVFCSQLVESMPSGLFVAAIDLNHANLKGCLVRELSLLFDLTVFHINSNRFSGTVPDSFRDLENLSELDLSNNQFSGPFPSVTLLLPSLIYLDIRFNHFTGSLPEGLFNKNLDAIFLNNNLFDGQIPQSLGNSPASVINLANNRFVGSIPASFGYMGPRIKEILFLNNKLTGCIPEGVGLLSEIELLDVSFNSLSGHLPDIMACLSEIEVLNLAHNNFSGVIPDIICSLKNLLNLTVSYNFFSGFTQDCGNARNFGFDFIGNCIPGSYMQRPPPECLGTPININCLRIPAAGPVVCGSADLKQTNNVKPQSRTP